MLVIFCIDCKCIHVQDILEKCFGHHQWITTAVTYYKDLSQVELGKLSLILSMAVFINTLVIFVYGRYHNGIYGICAEDIIKYSMRMDRLEFYRNASVVLPVIAAAAHLLHWVCTPVVCSVFMYCLILKFVHLISNLMRKSTNLEIMQAIVKDDYLKALKELENITPTGTIWGYEVDTGKGKVWRSKEQIYYSLASRTILQLLKTKERGRENEEVFRKAYEALINIKEGSSEIAFLYMYDLTVELFSEEEKNQRFSWKLSLIKEIQNVMNGEERQENGRYIIRAQYMALACGLLISGTGTTERFLWYDFMENLERHDKNIAECTFVMIIVFMEFLARREIVRAVSYDVIKSNADEIRIKILDLQDQCWNETEKFCFALALLGIDTQEEAERSFGDVKNDISHVLDEEYIPKTKLGIILQKGE